MLKEVVKKARELISSESRWCQGESAVDKNMRGVPTNSIAACRWCAYGALNRVGMELYGPEGYFNLPIDSFMQRVRADTGVELTRFNDTHTHEEVLALLDRILAVLPESKVVAEDGR